MDWKWERELKFAVDMTSRRVFDDDDSHRVSSPAILFYSTLVLPGRTIRKARSFIQLQLACSSNPLSTFYLLIVMRHFSPWKHDHV